jgi:hypothetical protein
MTTQALATGPFCAWVIAREYYDGPMAGIGLRARDQMKIFFRAVAWDSEQWNRLFVITPVRAGAVEHLRTVLTKIEKPKEPFWLPGAATSTPEVAWAWDAVLADAYESRQWSLAESHDLLDAAKEMILPPELASGVVRLVQQGSVRDIDNAALLPPFLDQLFGPAKSG